MLHSYMLYLNQITLTILFAWKELSISSIPILGLYSKISIIFSMPALALYQQSLVFIEKNNMCPYWSILQQYLGCYIFLVGFLCDCESGELLQKQEEIS
jgi:hypothetical protein